MNYKNMIPIIVIYHPTFPIYLAPSTHQVQVMIQFFSSHNTSQCTLFPSEIDIKKQSTILTLDSDQTRINIPPPTHKSLLQYPVSYPSIDVNKIISPTNYNSSYLSISLEEHK